ncbi:MAG: hypothetical protein HY304_02110 [candidate division Zixibacteria bacterium]|nr:hypothetical protein [candidate division Zixibacteria bacterium]
MKRNCRRWLPIAFVAAGLVAYANAQAQEHPEHPQNPAAGLEKKKDTVTIPMLSKAIHDYVADDAKLKGGFFLVFDPQDKKVLQLTLAKVHEEKLATLGNGVYFACADFQASDGHLYDLDVFMKGSDKNLETTEVSVHKVDGKPRYNWSEKDGVWSKVDLPTK